MHSLFFTLSALLALTAVYAVPAGQPSNVPTCTFTCPPTDKNGFVLADHTNDGVTLFCSYPAIEGEDPHDFFCNYSSTTGALTLDNDADLCFGTAVSSCANGAARRRSALPQAPAAPMAAPVARTPEEMKVRALLKRQPVQVEA